MASASLALSSLLLLLLPLLVLTKGGFNVELIHRDSPKSPLYNPSKTLPDWLRDAVRSSIARTEHLHRVFFFQAASNGSYQSPVIPDFGSYLMEVNIGTPAKKYFAQADTGSDLIWTDCTPCDYCYPQEAPLFDPTKSSTYRNISFHSKTCADIPNHFSYDNSTCQYLYTYGGSSSTYGDVASETFIFDTISSRPVQIPKIVFGCSHSTDEDFDKLTAGIVGLGGGPLSLVSQLGTIIDKKFSYCLVPYSNNSLSSKISFGAGAIVSGRNVVSTPLIPGDRDTFYTVSLQSLTLDGDSIPVQSGDIVVDSGITITMLHSSVVRPLVDKLKKMIHLPVVPDPPEGLELCFDIRRNPRTRFPDITFQFDGAALVLSPINTFALYDENTMCLAIMSSEFPIFGNIAQQNFHVGFDLDSRKISFAPADCTKF